MTIEEVTRAVQSAARQAFAMGLDAAKEKGRTFVQKHKAVTYAEDLVLPIARAAIEQGREEGWQAARQDMGAAANDPGPEAA